MINRVVLIGRLTKDIEVNKTQSGVSVTSFQMAVERNVKNDKGEKETDFISCVAWRQSADYLGQYAKKGNLVAMDGRLQVRSYEDSNKNRRTAVEVVADNVNILEFHKDSHEGLVPQERAGKEIKGDGTYPIDISSDDLPF